MPSSVDPNPPVILYHAAAIRDAAGVDARPGSVVTRGGRILEAGPTADIVTKKSDADRVVTLPDTLLLPGFVNTHVHLDLTPIGPLPYTGSFASWVMTLGPLRPRGNDAVADAVRQGVKASRAAGVVAVGDIVHDRTDSDMPGVGFIELVGHDAQRARQQVAAGFNGVRGVQPHAPYSTSPALYEVAVNSGLPVATHLAELREETRFIAHGDGPMRDLIEKMAGWNDTWLEPYGKGLSPVQWMKPYLERRPWLVVHCNYVDDDDIDLLAATGASVAYCPIASEYFGHHDHRYRDMLARGVNVCLGTDSILCQPANEPQPLGILPQMRRLYQRDGTDPLQLLVMATIHGAKALQLDSNVGTLSPGAPACVAAVRFDDQQLTDPLTQILKNDYPVSALVEGDD